MRREKILLDDAAAVMDALSDRFGINDRANASVSAADLDSSAHHIEQSTFLDANTRYELSALDFWAAVTASWQ